MNQEFEKEKEINIRRMVNDTALRELSRKWIEDASRYKYSYNFTWLGIPIIQFPQDIVIMQELIWSVKPDMVVETGIAHGGSLILYASILELLGGDGRVLGVDIDIRRHNRVAIEQHPMHKRISMIQGSSIDTDIARAVHVQCSGRKRIMVVLDSNHTHDHVLQELLLYSPLTTKESYLVVFDTIIEDLAANYFADRPWEKGNNPKTAINTFLKTTDRFIIDANLESKLCITVAPSGFLKCIKD
jgi:cephalosporin hydroxylase